MCFLINLNFERKIVLFYPFPAALFFITHKLLQNTNSGQPTAVVTTARSKFRSVNLLLRSAVLFSVVLFGMGVYIIEQPFVK